MLKGEGISKVYPGGARALDDVTFAVHPGEVLSLLGPSGCGKSTLLRIVAGLDDPTEGTLTLDGVSLVSVPAGRRDVGFVFQNYALYPHLSVRGNLSLALKTKGLPSGEIASRVAETAEMLGLQDLLDRRPAQLSGGQQQRVALGRALVKRPRFFLLDEPLSNLDALLREEMRSGLRDLFRRVGATVIYVTHDQAEAMSLSDRVLVMESGRVRQCAPPLELYARPADLFTATFVGTPRLTVWRGVISGETFATGDLHQVVPGHFGPRREAWLGIRPEHVRVAAERFEGAREAKVSSVEVTGERVLLTLSVGSERLRAFAEARDWPERVHVRLDPQGIHLFDAANGCRLR